MGKKATLKDIAKICECSVTTVSRALKDSDTISLALRRKVKQTAEELGYIPNSIASSMRTGFTKVIAIILQDFRNPFYSIMAKNIERHAHALGYSTLFLTTSESTQREMEAVTTVISKNVDGILLFPIQRDDKSTRFLLQKQTPFVLVGRYFEHLNTNYVISDDEYGAYIVTKHLLEKGHQNILFLNTHPFIYSATMRRDGYLRALTEYHLADRAHICEVSMEYGQSSKTVKQLFQDKEKNKYDAILAYCDLIGFEAYYALNQLGYRIPQDIAIASIDDIHSDIVLPVHLTGAGCDRNRMAKEAVNLLMRVIQNEAEENPLPLTKNKIVVAQYLVIGETT